MVERYAVTLNSPMGPRQGMLELVFGPSEITGNLHLLGFDNPVSGRQTGDGCVRLRHCLRSLISELRCVTDLKLAQGQLSGTSRADQCSILWSGTRTEPLP